MARTATLDGMQKTLEERRVPLAQAWVERLKRSGTIDGARTTETEALALCTQLLGALAQGLGEPGGGAAVRDLLSDFSRRRAMEGFTPRETALFVMTLKPTLQDALAGDAALARLLDLLDDLALHTFEVFHTSREEIIIRQQQEIAELSTPVIKLWDGVLALPLIGTLDSHRTQVVMENLLEAIVQQSADIAIIDITGVPTVDTLTAQHLLKTVAAARLMGADCIISGIRPQIAQTMVHLGVELSVVSKATLADAFALALQRQGKRVAKVAAAVAPAFG